TQRLNVTDRWPQLDADLAEALSYGGTDAVYLDEVGLLYAQRYATSGEPESYQKSAFLLEEAHRHNPFNPYPLIHRADLEIAALQKKAVNQPSAAMDDLIRAA